LQGVANCNDVPCIAGVAHWVSMDGYTSPNRNRAIANRRLLELIRDSYVASNDVYGAPRMYGDLREAGETCGRNRVARLTRINKIAAVRGYKSPRRIAGRPSILAPNRVDREYKFAKPDSVWVTDITSIRTRLAVFGRRRRPFFLPGHRLVDEADGSTRTRAVRFADGVMAA